MTRSAGILMRARSTGRYLLLRRRGTGLWETPGGHVELGETPREAAVREFEEETGFRGWYTIFSPTRPHRLGKFMLYEAETARQFTPRLSVEHVAYAWVDRDVVSSDALHPGLEGFF